MNQQRRKLNVQSPKSSHINEQSGWNTTRSRTSTFSNSLMSLSPRFSQRLSPRSTLKLSPRNSQFSARNSQILNKLRAQREVKVQEGAAGNSWKDSKSQNMTAQLQLMLLKHKDIAEQELQEQQQQIKDNKLLVSSAPKFLKLRNKLKVKTDLKSLSLASLDSYQTIQPESIDMTKSMTNKPTYSFLPTFHYAFPYKQGPKQNFMKNLRINLSSKLKPEGNYSNVGVGTHWSPPTSRHNSTKQGFAYLNASNEYILKNSNSSPQQFEKGVDEKDIKAQQIEIFLPGEKQQDSHMHSQEDQVLSREPSSARKAQNSPYKDPDSPDWMIRVTPIEIPSRKQSKKHKKNIL